MRQNANHRASVTRVTQHTSAELFSNQIDSWRAWQHAPWGRIRYRVVAETLRRTCAALGSSKLRVVDVGGGDGADALGLAEAGHDVTVVDYSEPLLAAAEAAAEDRGLRGRVQTVRGEVTDVARLGLGSFDLVLCHNVIQYLPDTRAVIDSLVGITRPNGALSVIAANPSSDVLTAVVRREDLAEAERMLTAASAIAHTFGHDVRRISYDEVATALAERGFTVHTRYGVRTITDYVPHDDRKREPAFYDQLERLELQLCDREPYLRIARFWQLIARRGERQRGHAQQSQRTE